MTRDALPDDLPFLTEIVSPPPTVELPLLTDIAALPDAAPDGLPVLDEMAVSDELPMLEIVATEDAPRPAPPEGLALDTQPLPPPECAAPEACTEPYAPLAEHPVPEQNALDGDDIAYLLQHIEEHLSTVFTEKLNSQLEQLQKLAVDLAVSEFKAELPQLLRDALERHARK